MVEYLRHDEKGRKKGCERHEFRFMKILSKNPLIYQFYCVHCLDVCMKRSDLTDKEAIKYSNKSYENLLKLQQQNKTDKKSGKVCTDC